MQKDLPLVSVIMPAYNCEAFIKQAIDSVLRQTYPNWELIVADDGSTDNTKAIIDAVKDERVVKTHNDTNQGNIRTRNRLFEQARGEFIAVLDADDWMAPDRLKKQLQVFQIDSSIGACLTNFFLVDVHKRKNLASDRDENLYLDQVAFDAENRILAPSIMVSREVYKNVGGLHLYFDKLFAEDRYWIQLILEKYKILVVAEPLYYYRTNVSSLTNSFDNIRKLTIVALVDELIRQRREKGSDWLSEDESEKALAYEKSLLANKKWIGEKYRIRAARSIDLLQLNKASKLLVKAMLLNFRSWRNIKTAFYLFNSILKYKLYLNRNAKET